MNESNRCSFNQEFKLKVCSGRIKQMVELLKKDVKHKTFIRELIEDCKIDKPGDEFIFDASAFKFENIIQEIEHNWSFNEDRQFDILLVDKNRDAIAISYHPAISADYPAPVDLKRFNLHHCIQLLFMPDDTYRTRPDDGNGRYYYQYRDFHRFLKKKGVPLSFQDTINNLYKANIHFTAQKEKKLIKYLELFAAAGCIKHYKSEDLYVANGKLKNYHIAFWLKKVMFDKLKVRKIKKNKKTIPWEYISSIILTSNFEIYSSLDNSLSNYLASGPTEELEQVIPKSLFSLRKK
jgi:hypothetical protein